MNRIYQAVSSLFQNEQDNNNNSIPELSGPPSTVATSSSSFDATQVVCVHIFTGDMKKTWFYSQETPESCKISSISSDVVTDDTYFPKTCFIAFIRGGKRCKLYSLDGRLVYVTTNERYLFVASKEQVEPENTQSEFWIEEEGRTGMVSFGIYRGGRGGQQMMASEKDFRYVCLERNGSVVADRKAAKSWEHFCLIPVPLSYMKSPEANITVRIVDHRGRFLTVGDRGKVYFHHGPCAAIRDSISLEYSKQSSTCRLRSTWNGHYIRLETSDPKRPFLVADGEDSSVAAVFHVHWHKRAFFSLELLSSGFLSSRPNGTISCSSMQDSTWERFHLSCILSCVPRDAPISISLEKQAHSRRVLRSSVVVPCDGRTAYSVISDYDHLHCFCRHVLESSVKKQLSEDEYEIQTVEQHGFLFFSKKSQQLLRVKESYPHSLVIDLISSNVLKEYRAVWTIEPLQEEEELCCSLSLHVHSKPKSSIPSFVLDSVCKSSCIATMEDIQKECIRRMKCNHLPASQEEQHHNSKLKERD